MANVAEDKGIVDNAVEKDYWVSMVLRAIFCRMQQLLFSKGGTSLSKGWGLIERFQEDIDLAIDPQYLGFTNIETKSQRTKLRKDSKKFIDGSFALDVENRLKEFGLSEYCKVIVPETSVSDLDPVVLFVEYNSVLQTKMQYIPERVKVGDKLSFTHGTVRTDVEMRSMIEDAYPGEEFSLPIFTVLP